MALTPTARPPAATLDKGSPEPSLLQAMHCEIAGARIHLLTGGSGPPLLVLHGGEGALGWRPMLERLAQHHTVVFPSHPGYDGSTRPDWLCSVPDIARCYLAMCEALGLEQLRVMGHSLGGWMAAEMAVSAHRRLERLVLVDAAGLRPREGTLPDVFSLTPQTIRALAYHDPEHIPGLAQLVPASPEAQAQAARNLDTLKLLLGQPGYLHPPALEALLPGLRVPTHIVWGRQDRIIPPECAQLYQHAIAGSTLEVIDACGHRPHIEQPEAFLHTVLPFLR